MFKTKENNLQTSQNKNKTERQNYLRKKKEMSKIYTRKRHRDIREGKDTTMK